MKWFRTLSWLVILLLLIALGASLLLTSLPKYETARQFIDLFARDQSFESFTPSIYSSLRLPFLILGGLLISVALLAIIFYRRSQALLGRLFALIGKGLKRFGQDFAILLKQLLKPGPRWVLPAILFLTVLGLIARILFISRPMQHDEAYTYIAFASRPFFKVISDYHLPNNHIFHNIWVFFSTRLFGIAPWAVRLPALLAGTMVIPLAYLLASKLYSRSAGVVSAALTAFAPVLLNYSTNARGYTMLAMFTLITWILGYYIRRHNNSAAWLLLAFFGALGFYTVPVFLNAYGILFIWLFLSLIFKDIGPEYHKPVHFLLRMILAGVFTILFTVLAYAPVLIFSGFKAFFGNAFVQSLSMSDFLQTAPLRAIDLWQEWTYHVSPMITALLLAGLTLSALMHHKISKAHIATQAAALTWLVPVLLVQRPNPWSKIWLMLLPIVLVWCAGGLMGTIEYLFKNKNLSKKVLAWSSAVLVIIFAVAGLLRAVRAYPNLSTPGSVEQTVIYLQDKLQPGDAVFLTDPEDAPLWYYWRLHDLDQTFLDTERDDIKQFYVLVYLMHDHTLENRLETDLQLFPDVDLAVSKSQLVANFGSNDLYLLDYSGQVQD